MGDTTAAVNSYNGLRQENLMLKVQTSLLKKSMDVQSSSMTALLETMPKAPNPPNLGRNVDTTL